MQTHIHISTEQCKPFQVRMKFIFMTSNSGIKFVDAFLRSPLLIEILIENRKHTHTWWISTDYMHWYFACFVLNASWCFKADNSHQRKKTNWYRELMGSRLLTRVSLPSQFLIYHRVIAASRMELLMETIKWAQRESEERHNATMKVNPVGLLAFHLQIGFNSVSICVVSVWVCECTCVCVSVSNVYTEQLLTNFSLVIASWNSLRWFQFDEICIWCGI